MSEVGGAATGEPAESLGGETLGESSWFISAAFTTALVFGPLVIAAGFLTARSASSGGDVPTITLAALRPSFDPGTP